MIEVRPFIGRWLLGGLLLLGTGCQSGGVPGPSEFASPSVQSAPAADQLDCSPIALRTPGGQPIDLSGTWTGGNTRHDVRQLNSCVWWLGVSNWPGEEPGSAWAFVFSGHLRPDFTLSGEWAEIYTAELRTPGQGVVTFEVQVTDENGEEAIVLRRDNTVEIEDQDTDYVADTLRRLE